jgi:hypothetical protein
VLAHQSTCGAVLIYLQNRNEQRGEILPKSLLQVPPLCDLSCSFWIKKLRVIYFIQGKLIWTQTENLRDECVELKQRKLAQKQELESLLPSNAGRYSQATRAFWNKQAQLTMHAKNAPCK